MFVTKETILSSTLATQQVDVPEWGGMAMVRELTGAERDEYESYYNSIMEKKKEVPNGISTWRNVRARLVATCLVDEQGARIFPEPVSEEAIEMLGQKSAAALDRLWTAAMQLSGLLPKSGEKKS